MSTPETLTTEIQKLSPSAVIELFVVDATSLGGDVLRFHAGTNGLKQNVVWQGETYVRFPVQVTGFEFNGQGQLPRPKMSVANIFSSITQVLLQYNDLLGAKVTRKRTMAKFLDAVNFSGGVNLTEDPAAEFADDVFYVDRKASEDRDAVEFELASSMDLAGVQLPRRQIIQNICVWAYRGAECGYAGAPFWDKNDNDITTATSTEGQTLLNARFALLAAQQVLADKVTALAAAATAVGPACDVVNLSTIYDWTGYEFAANYAVLVGPSATRAYWGGSLVSLNWEFRMGSKRSTFNVLINGTFVSVDGYYIERWGVDSVGCASATTAYNTALSDRDTAQAAVDSAQTALDAAFAALPSDDALYSVERCGKRLASCKLRFGETGELPFGSFPAAGLIK